MTQTSHNILYSYRRCPYAMRARMALVSAGVQCKVHEIVLRDKPPHMIEISPKGTVPVLQMAGGQVIDESLDIMLWALKLNDPQGWLAHDDNEVNDLITRNDGVFKAALDRYKYPDRFEGEDCSDAREQGVDILAGLNARLKNNKNLCGDTVSMLDIAIFPFIRQFANIDRKWFDALDLKPLQGWLAEHLESDVFQSIFKKQKDSPYNLLSS
jgi:glutathione S-transferase